jgi:hypothetical protein
MSDNYNVGMQSYADDTTHQNHIEFLIERALNRRNHAILVKVVNPPYDSSGNAITPGTAGAIGFVDVLPLVNQVDGWGLPVPHETVYHLQYFRYQGGSNAFICDPASGDVGKMVVADRDTSLVKATGHQSNPGSARRGSYSDGTYFGVAHASTPTQFFAFLAQGFKIVDTFGNSIQGTADGVIINGATITLTGDFVNPANTSFTTHTHKEGSLPTGDSAQPTVVS